MKQLFICFSFVALLMACSTRPTLVGRWAMEMDRQDTAIIVGGNTVVAPELKIERDTIYMEIRTNGIVARREFIGIYSIKDNLIIVTNRMGKQKVGKYELKDGVLTVIEKDDPDKIIMRLIKINEG